ncbi:hypothetical protein [Lihuaxuella thermophila]|uniref:Uncharacterized protein n=1 Tax=Lihuaxuella thermophila TaxID=1173111 RepID=A0A1H8DLS9_9BACL|nr:hypothetical protein [Lihuaxuella thermophila]SEN07498.1 hypothetical protein SAMN05444955_105219 [Lihuaxuella thermophila]
MLKLCVTGEPSELYHFMNDLKTQPRYNVRLVSNVHDQEDDQETKVLVNVDLIPEISKPLTVKLESANGQELVINLLDGMVVELDEGVTYISGKVFDVFG